MYVNALDHICVPDRTIPYMSYVNTQHYCAYPICKNTAASMRQYQYGDSGTFYKAYVKEDIPRSHWTHAPAIPGPSNTNASEKPEPLQQTWMRTRAYNRPR